MSPGAVYGRTQLTRRRDATRVIYDILMLGRRGASKTEVIYKANLSFHLAERYISFLLARQHLQLSIDGRGVRRYSLTAKGGHLLSFLVEIQKELEGLFAKGPISNVPSSIGPTIFELLSDAGNDYRD